MTKPINEKAPWPDMDKIRAGVAKVKASLGEIREQPIPEYGGRFEPGAEDIDRGKSNDDCIY